MRADRWGLAVADLVADHVAAGGAWVDLGGDFRVHAIVERVHLRVGVHPIDREEDRASRHPDRAGHRRCVSVGFTNGWLSAGIGAGGADLFVLCGILCIVNDWGVEGVRPDGARTARPTPTDHP